ncbi:alpha-hydroxy acid oxidase [Caenimonas aquaedulcis]|uniref:Alpha-hydroxy-acid oxidizing protein n=1 Tax=Caenimonas aquaedulcis TaxID=2793270 RepID=A0A931H3K2_9BURK|nr:alpha-hydroxy acid oxidase [Caenimonas aquaedulcis]MBG9387969.1 alpha-hydroxy-acid oxidizing protein [Caenimonas aquaedulcis]
MAPLNVEDFRILARRRLPRGMFEYVDRGTEDEVGLRSVHSGLEQVKLRPRVLNDVSAPDTSTVVLGDALPMPVIVSPTAVAGLLWHDGEVQLARAARRAGIPFCVATQSMTTMEEIAERAPGANLWFQLYVFEDRKIGWQLLERAKALGIRNLLFTVDTARSPKKEWNTRNGFGIPIQPSLVGAMDLLVHPRWTLSVMARYMLTTGIPVYAHYPPEYLTRMTRASAMPNVKLARKLTWDDVDEVRRRWDGNLVIKGVMDREDAQQAVLRGADGIVVSCHGGRNLDASPPALQVLPGIADAVGHKLTVLADSGIRRGSHIAKFLACGARAVLVGRAPLYGMAASGEQGAHAVLEILREELDHCMAFTGHGSLDTITRDVIAREC